MSTSKTVAIRALNSCRTRHYPTYVALRALLESQQNDELDQLIRVAKRKLQTRSSWRYFRHPLVKEVKSPKNVEYRECMIGSPFTLIAESVLLRDLSQEPSFTKPGNVYSYLWPRSSLGGRNYEYYRNGFRNRNQEISNLLASSPGSVVVVNDIQRFYPSVNWNELSKRIEVRLSKIKSHRLRHCAELFISSYRANCTAGLEVGPDISHMLADIALEDVDAQMITSWGRNYFRYVDDIIVVCTPSKVDEVQKQLSQLVAPLKLHDEKMDIVSSEVWMNDAPDLYKLDKKEFTFERLLRTLELTILYQPERFFELQAEFRENGFSIPMKKIAVKSRYGRFKSFLMQWTDSKVREAIRLNTATLLSEVNHLRERLIARAGELSDSLPEQGTSRRWGASKLRYLVNRIIYLSNRQTFGEILEFLPERGEFNEQRVLLNALRDNRPYDLLPYPGAVISTFCELTTGGGFTPDFSGLPDVLSDAEAESLAIYIIHFCDEMGIKKMPNTSLDYQLLLSQLSGLNPSKDTAVRQSYLDESGQLLRYTTPKSRKALATSRTSIRETRGLEGFALGDDSDDDDMRDREAYLAPLHDGYI